MNQEAPDRRFTMEQLNGIDLCCDLSQRIASVTGAAGTGKTLVLGEAYKQLRKIKSASRIVLTAPTGRAAKRIQELTGIKSKTIHRLLEFPMPDDPVEYAPSGKIKIENPVEVKGMAQADPEPRRNRFNPIVEEVVFVDESSMVNPKLHAQLINALPASGCIRFFGDINQLPPVEEGIPPFVDTLRRYPKVELSMNFRNDNEIIQNANRILRGNIPLRNSRFEVIYTEQPIRYLARFATEEFMRSDHQIIMPTRRGKFGTGRINPDLQLKFNGRGEVLQLARFDNNEPDMPIRGGDKFLWIKNDYSLKIFNGEIGMVDWVNEEDGTLQLSTPEAQVLVPARVKVYSPYMGSVINYDPRKQIELGYAITTHKSQGSEFGTVVYCMCSGAAYNLNRNNFYTGITRAKEKVVVIADRRAMALSMRRIQL